MNFKVDHVKCQYSVINKVPVNYSNVRHSYKNVEANIFALN